MRRSCLPVLSSPSAGASAISKAQEHQEHQEHQQYPEHRKGSPVVAQQLRVLSVGQLHPLSQQRRRLSHQLHPVRDHRPRKTGRGFSYQPEPEGPRYAVRWHRLDRRRDPLCRGGEVRRCGGQSVCEERCGRDTWERPHHTQHTKHTKHTKHTTHSAVATCLPAATVLRCDSSA